MSDEVPCTAASVLPVVWLCGCAFPHVSGLPPTGSTYEGRPANFRRAYDNIMSSPVSNVGGGHERGAKKPLRAEHVNFGELGDSEVVSVVWKVEPSSHRRVPIVR
eukprot:CAMPEP_0171672326 /NCGR_PEP_ID=MMETSP0990-20121206/51919_1 /TAXON_ID=483369 /ORGANISM="non described non described, Strain CCMP2098" /LENGTH=104 /DNA_ID=CAMNT_0012257587 /DNA_START=151 /DNA_END=463 /DNA_ORIENTATION=+